ncbi:MAG: hypothetical protein ABSF22_21415 [Bryobacteraceae bacterium]
MSYKTRLLKLAPVIPALSLLAVVPLMRATYISDFSRGFIGGVLLVLSIASIAFWSRQRASS